MKKNTLSMFMAVGLLGTGASLLSEHSAAAQSISSGALRGQIKDNKTGEVIIGATVAATSSSLQGQQVVITDETGSYSIDNLPAGMYTLTVYYNDKQFSRGNVLVQTGKQAVVNVPIDTSVGEGKGGEVVVIKGHAPVIDEGSSKLGSTFTSDYTNNLPVGRTFGEVVGAAAGSQGDFYGVGFSGSGSSENTYIVEGLNTTDTGFGGQSTNLPNEFVEETEVITAGYNAEYGRSTGGIINVVTKSGTNEFHGSVFGYYTPGALVASSDAISNAGSTIAGTNALNYDTDFGAEIGGPIIKDKLWFHVGFNPSYTNSTVTRTVGRQSDTQNQVDPSGAVDANGMPIAVPDTVECAQFQLQHPGTPCPAALATGTTLITPLSHSSLPLTSSTYNFTAKINGAINENHQFQISAFGNPSTTNNVFNPATVPSNPADQQDLIKQGAWDVSAKWNSKFNDGKTELEAIIGYHHGYVDQLPTSGTAAQAPADVYYNYSRSLYDFADLEGANAIAGCNDKAANDALDPHNKIVNCPVNQYTESGLGFLESRNNDRKTLSLTATQRVKALGYHTIKVGVDGELASYDSIRGYTGGETLRRNSDNTWLQTQYLQIDRGLTTSELAMNKAGTFTAPNGEITCIGNGSDQTTNSALCSVNSNGLVVDTSDRNLGAFVQDSWQIRPNITLDLGLRWEQQTAYFAQFLQGTVDPASGLTIPDQAMQLNNLWAPRIGVIWDPTDEGRSKIFGHWGRFYESIPMDINVRAFGGEITQENNLNQDPVTGANAPSSDTNCNVDHGDGVTGGIADRLKNCKVSSLVGTLGGGSEYVTPGIGGQYLDEFIIGGEYEIAPDFKVGISYQHRSLPQIIEDLSTDNANDYLITNPAGNFDAQAKELQTEAAAAQLAGNTRLAALDLSRASQLVQIKSFDTPTRYYDALQLTVEQRPTKKSLLKASYTYSQNRGNYPGLFSTETNQLDPNLTSEYDLKNLMANRYGPLGLDRPHLLKIDGFYEFDLKQAGLITAGASFRVQSGLAHNTLGGDYLYGASESYLLPRGSEERSPTTWEVDVHISYGRKLSKTS